MPFFAATIAKLDAIAATEIAIASSLITLAGTSEGASLGTSTAYSVRLAAAATAALKAAEASLIPINAAGAALAACVITKAAAGVLLTGIYAPAIAAQATKTTTHAARGAA